MAQQLTRTMKLKDGTSIPEAIQKLCLLDKAVEALELHLVTLPVKETGKDELFILFRDENNQGVYTSLNGLLTVLGLTPTLDTAPVENMNKETQRAMIA